MKEITSSEAGRQLKHTCISAAAAEREDKRAISDALWRLNVLTTKDDASLRADMAYGMFDTRGKVRKECTNSARPLCCDVGQRCSVKSFKPKFQDSPMVKSAGPSTYTCWCRLVLFNDVLLYVSATWCCDLLQVDPFDPNSPIKQAAVEKFPPDMFFVLRVVQLLRGMANGEPPGSALGRLQSCRLLWKLCVQVAMLSDFCARHTHSSNT